MKLNRLGIMLTASIAMVLLSGLAATVAQAEGGPEWRLKGANLLTGETRETISENVSTVFTLKGPTNIECTKAENTEPKTGFLLGGNPGTDFTKITFKGCSVAGKTVAECGAKGLKPLPATNAGEVIVDVLTVLVYPVGSRTSALDAFAPEGETGNENLYVEFELTGTNCALLNKSKVPVKASGTEIEIKKEKRNCGVLAQVGKPSGTNTFELTGSGAIGTVGLLNFPATAITKAEIWEPSTKTFKEITCELRAFNNNVATEVGLAKVKTSPEEEFGWIE